MTKHIPLPTDPAERKHEQYRRHMLSVGRSQQRRAEQFKIDHVNLDLIGGQVPPAIAARVKLPKEPNARKIEQRFRNARRMAIKRAAQQRREARALPVTPLAREAEIKRRAQARYDQFLQDNGIGGARPRNLLDV